MLIAFLRFGVFAYYINCPLINFFLRGRDRQAASGFQFTVVYSPRGCHKGRSQGLGACSPCGWKAPSCFTSHLSPPWVCLSRKLGLGVELKPKHGRSVPALPFQSVCSGFLACLQSLYKHCHYPITEHFHQSRRVSSSLLAVTPHSTFCQPRASINLLSVNIPMLDLSYKYSHTCEVFSVSSFTQGF